MNRWQVTGLAAALFCLGLLAQLLNLTPEPTAIPWNPKLLNWPATAYAITPPQQNEWPQDLKAAIIPHHLPLTTKLQSSLFEHIAITASTDITIVLLAPDHYSSGMGVTTTEEAFETPSGLVKVNQSLIAELLKDLPVANAVFPFKREHAILGQMPFIAAYLPDATVVPLIFNHNVSAETSHQIAQWLSANLSDEDLVVLTTDLSHDLPASSARAQDAETITGLLAMDTQSIVHPRLDTVPGARAFLDYAAIRQITDSQLIVQATAADFGAPAEAVTGYAVIGYGFEDD